MKYRIYKAQIGWNVLCPCGGYLQKAMSWERAVDLCREMIRLRMC